MPDGSRQSWPWAELRLEAARGRRAPVRLSRATPDRPYVDVDQAGFRDALLRFHPARGDRRRDFRTTARRNLPWAIGVAAIAMLVFASASFLPPILAGLVPADFERRLGERAVADIAQVLGAFDKGSGRFCETAAGRAALDRLVHRLAATTDSPHPPQVRVADIDMVNAFATPGGQVLLLRGLLKEARSVDEVAGVLAHELGHVRHRHPTEGLIRRIGLGAVLDFLAGGTMGGGIIEAAGAVLIETAHSREAEADADQAAIAMLRAADISTDGLQSFFKRLAAEGGEATGALRYLSTHPPSADRAARIGAAPAGATTLALNARDWRALRAICGA